MKFSTILTMEKEGQHKPRSHLPPFVIVVKRNERVFTLIYLNTFLLILTYPPMEMPVIPSGQYPSLFSQCSSAVDSRIKAPPMTKRSDTFFRQERLEQTHIIYVHCSPRWQ